MVQITMNLPKKENQILDKYKEEWGLNKAETLFKMIRDFKRGE